MIARQTLVAAKDSRVNGLEMGIVFIISPVVALISALRNRKDAWARNALWFFVAFFGFTMHIPPHMDSSRYSERLSRLSRIEFSGFEQFASLIYREDTEYVDVLEPVITYAVSRVTDNSRILFLLFGLIFGYFYSRNFFLLLSLTGGRLKREAIPFLVLAGLAIGFWQINGFRFWTAAHIFIYGVLTIYVRGLRSGFFIAALSPFVHFTFVLPLLLLTLLFLVGSWFRLTMAIYFFSFFATELNPGAFTAYESYVPKVFIERTRPYVDEEYREGVVRSNLKASWYVTFRHRALRYAFNLVLLVLLWRFRSELEKNKVVLAMLCLALLLSAVTNVLNGISSVSRFQVVADVIMAGSIFLFAQLNDTKVFSTFTIGIFSTAAALYLAVEFRVAFEVISLLTVLGNPMVAPFIQPDFPLIDLIK